ncbi:MAG: MFS transporter [Planctomycetota bacterium]|nr:MAG: MFS transporter [Planctomycetota bacterium]
MSNKPYLTAPPPITTMPPGIPFIVVNEAAERFSFYGMKSILAVFMTKHLVDQYGRPAPMTEEQANYWIHSFVTATYFFPIFGAIVSDWLLGKYRTILSVSLLYCVGHAVLALMGLQLGIEPKTLLWWGLALIAVGAGGIKPCVSAHVGDQFGETNQHLISRVFAWFYFSINLGAATSTVLTPLLLKYCGPHWAFGVPGIFMGLATLVFWLGRYRFVHVPPAGRRFFSETFSRDGVRAIVNLIPLYLFVAMFWALFDQTASAWVHQAEKMNRWVTLPSGKAIELLPSQIQAANPILILLLIPTFSYAIYPLMNRFFEVTPLRKIGIGLFLTVPAFALPGLLQMRIDAGHRPHIYWQVAAYVIMTMAEVLVSITALEFSYTQAPRRMKSFVMGLFLLSVSLGNFFTAEINHFIETQRRQGREFLAGADYYWFFTAAMFLTACGFVIFAQFYRGRTYLQGAESEQPVPVPE